MSDISDQALACPHCAHDLYLIKPLLARIEALEEQLKTAPAAEAPAQSAAPPADAATIDTAPPAVLDEGFRYWLPPLLALLLAHFLITVAYDLNTLYLRLVSLLIPLPFAYYLMQGRRGYGPWLAGAFLLGLTAVLGMSGTISLVDHTPVLPQNLRESREFLEYAASIGFSYCSGMILGNTMRARREAEQHNAHALAVRLTTLVIKGSQSAEKIQSTVSKLQSLGGSLTAAATTAAAAYVGLKDFLGNAGN